MAVGLQRLVRRALLTHLKADAGLTALVPASSINPPGAPTWPFIVLRAPVTQRLTAAGLRGGEGAWDAHVFAGALPDLTAEDNAGLIGAEVERVLADNWLALEGGGRVRIRLSDIRLLPDGDEQHYHWFAQVGWRVMAT